MTSTIDRDEVERVAAGLTEEQRIAILGAVRCKDGWWSPNGNVICNRALARSGALTDLGAAVRQYLLEQEQQS